MREKIWKRFALVSILTGFLNHAWAVGPGFYLGLMFGAATNDGKPELVQLRKSCTNLGTCPPYVPPPSTIFANPRSNQWGTRFFLGYKMNPYAGFESGFTFYSSIDYIIDDSKPLIIYGDSNGVQIPLDTCSSSNVRVGAWDFVGRGSFPFGDWFEIYGKAGGAVTYIKKSGDLTPDGTRDCGRSSESAKFRPTVSLGANMSLSQNWVIDASWNRLFVGNIVKNIDFYALGFAYHFVDRYCGQFLCDD